MAGNIVAIDNSKKHYTKEERERRKSAEAKQKRKKIKLIKPDFLHDDQVAEAIWDRTVKLMKGIELLDNVDADMLARYCCIASRVQLLTQIMQRDALATNSIDKDLLQRVEATERLMATYAEKMGLTPAGRARLSKKKAEEAKDEDDDLYGK